MINTRITSIGLSGSGKTSYIIGMYDQLAVGIKGFTVVSGNEITSGNRQTKLIEDMLETLEDESLSDKRFPSATHEDGFDEYHFTLRYKAKAVMAFDWVDYSGKVLLSKGERYNDIIDSIKESCAVCIFIDGNLLCKNWNLSKWWNLRKECAKQLKAILTKMKKSGNVPPIIFAVTKYDICQKYIKSNDSLYKLITRCFGYICSKGIPVYVIPVTLGKNIANGDYRGDAEPDVFLPTFIGLYHRFHYLYYSKQISSDLSDYQLIKDWHKILSDNSYRFSKKMDIPK